MSSPLVTTGHAQTAKAREKHLRLAAERAVDDPAQLARAARIVRAALTRNRITVAELTEQTGGAA